MAIQDSKTAVAIVVLTLGSGFLVAVSDRYGWPLVLAIPAYTAVGLPAALRLAGVPFRPAVTATIVTVVTAMGFVSYLAR